MTKRIAILEATKTPYRPPVFESVGESSDVTVYYGNAAADYRKWAVKHDPENFDESSIWSAKIGPLVVPIFFWYQLLQEDYDEYIATSNSTMILCSITMMVLSKFTNTKLTIWTENIDTGWGLAQNRRLYIKTSYKGWQVVQKSLRKILYGQANRIVAFSKLAAELAESESPRRVPVITAPQAYPSSKLAESNSSISSSPESFTVVSVGHLSHRKGVDLLINAFNRIGKPCELLIAGEGPEEELLKDLAKGDDRVHFLGYVSEEKKSSLYETADLFVLPTRHDPWGLVVNEALQFNTPVITTEAAGASMILDDDHVVPPNDVAALQRVMKQEIETPTDPPQPPKVKAMAQPLQEICN